MLLELKNIKKYFPIKEGMFDQQKRMVKAVDGVSLSIQSGVNWGLVGESGSGKSTLAKVAMKLELQDEGIVLCQGKNIARSNQFRRDIQMVFQDPFSSLDPRFTIDRILREGLHLAKDLSKEAKKERIREIVKAVGLNDDIFTRFPHEFSGGERQRIAIARALSLHPKLLILDEAVSSLDVIIQNDILKLLKDLEVKFNLTYFFISHNLRVIQKVCHMVAVMYKGRIVEMAPTNMLFTNPIHPYTQQLLRAALHYKNDSSESDISLNVDASLVEKEPGHWVLLNS